MEDKLIEYADKIVAALESGVDFASEQAPLLIQEVLTYYTISYSIWLFFAFIFLCGGLYFTYKLIRIELNKDYFDDENVFFISIIGLIVNGISISIFISCFSSLIKILVSPRLFLIEKLTELL